MVELNLGMKNLNPAKAKDSIVPPHPPSKEFEQVKSDIIQLQQSASTERNEFTNIKVTINQLSAKLDNTIGDLQNSTIHLDDVIP